MKDKLRLAVGRLLTDAGPVLCRLPNVPGAAAEAEEDWFQDGAWRFNHPGKNALTTTFRYQS